MSETILVVDDEANIRDLIELYLLKDGYTVLTAGDGMKAYEIALLQKPDLIILDWMLPEMDGQEFCKQLRQKGYDMPIMMVTAKGEIVDQITMLEMGADEYVTKPFNPPLLVAQVKALLRRSAQKGTVDENGSAETITTGNLTIDKSAHTVTIDNEPVELRSKEFDLLVTLLEHSNKVLSRDQLLDQVWGYEYYGNTRTVDVHVAHLREKLTDSTIQIETVWGKGYKLRTNKI